MTTSPQPESPESAPSLPDASIKEAFLHGMPESPEPLKVVEPFGYILHWPKIGGGVTLLFDKSRVSGDAIGCKVTPVYEEAAIQAARNEAEAMRASGNAVLVPVDKLRDLQRNAERYQWLRDKSEWEPFDSGWLIRADIYGLPSASMDAAIDAAMKGDAYADQA